MAAGTRRQIGKATAFWDSSVVVALCVRQGLTQVVRSLYKTYEIVVWWATPVEIASALARLMRMGQLDGKELVQARKLAEDCRCVVGDAAYRSDTGHGCVAC